ncbi:MAG: penicillin-binding protein 2 [Rhodobacteraceae bacterium]|nr:penicillin-binding protein 2 [Paracoccaceae bacterium]
MYTLRSEFRMAHSKLSRRTMLLGLGQAAVLGALGARLIYLQVTESEKLSDLSDRNRLDLRPITPWRGIILDRNGSELAFNKKIYKITVTRREAGDVAAILRRLSGIVPMTESEIGERLQEIFDHREHIPVVVADEVNWEQVAAVSANAPALPGIRADVGSQRIYPFGSDFAHLVGIIGRGSREDLGDDPLLELPDFRIGKNGIEKGLDSFLRGRAGSETLEVDAHGRTLREIENIPARTGRSFRLTVDNSLQNFVMARLDGLAASAVIMDVTNGDLLAVASSPTFDPNKFVSRISQEEFDRLNQDELAPFFNRPTRGLYPPGSTFKMISALAALEAGLIDADSEFFCAGTFETSTRTFHCWKSNGHGVVRLTKSLSESCDVYYYNLAQLVGIEKISEMARRLGIGVRPVLPMPSIAAGRVPTKEWKVEQFNDPWVIGDSLNSSIGQGFVASTALQLTIMTARLATGRSVRPNLVLAIDEQNRPRSDFPDLEISDSSMELVRNGMFEAVNSAAGTAYSSRTADEAFLISGKTGTSQIRNITAQERLTGRKTNEELPRRLRDHSLFCCYGPSHEPRLAATVIVEHGGSGSQVAAPIARDLIMRAHYGRIPPLKVYPAEFRDQIRETLIRLRLRDPAGISS